MVKVPAQPIPQVLEHDGSLLACALNAASTALTDAAVPMTAIIGVAHTTHKHFQACWLTASFILPSYKDILTGTQLFVPTSRRQGDFGT